MQLGMSSYFIGNSRRSIKQQHDTAAGKLAGPHGVEGSAGPCEVPQSDSVVDLESIYSSVCDEVKSNEKVIMQNTQRVLHNNELFYTSVLLGDVIEVRAMIDSGSMPCTLSSTVVPHLEKAGVLKSGSLSPTEVVLVGCVGLKTKSVGVGELNVCVWQQCLCPCSSSGWPT
jgi:hypothetical protein